MRALGVFLSFPCAEASLTIVSGGSDVEASLTVVSGGSDVGSRSPLKNLGSHIDASHSRQPLVKGERLVRYEVNAVMLVGIGVLRHTYLDSW